MDVKRLELLRELSQRGTVSAVARATHRTPSAVSQQLKVLQREAGVPLTEPHGRGIRLTVAGRALADAATDIVVAIERAEGLWHEFMGQPAGEVKLTTFPSGGEMFLPGVLNRLKSTPHVRLLCTDQDTRFPDFADLTPDYDLVVADASVGSPAWHARNLHVTHLMSEPLDIALPEGHRLAAKESLTAEDVIDEDWIGVPEDYPFDRILKEIQNVTGRTAKVLQRFDVNDVVEALVATGHGIAILPRFTTRERGNGLVTRPIEGIRSRREVFVLMRPERFERPSVRLVLQALEDEARSVAENHGAV